MIFEVRPTEAGYQSYLNIAARLRPELEAVNGFVSVERFASVNRKGWLLSLSLWHNEAALVAWRQVPNHRTAQSNGRTSLFGDYRIRVATLDSVLNVANADCTLPTTTAVSAERDASTCIVLEESHGAETSHLDAPRDAEDADVFESLTSVGKHMCLSSWPSRADAMAWSSLWCEALPPGSRSTLRVACVIRDYGMFDRSDAPQYYPPVEHRQ